MSNNPYIHDDDVHLTEKGAEFIVGQRFAAMSEEAYATIRADALRYIEARPMPGWIRIFGPETQYLIHHPTNR